jgi:hypothetical protein
MGKKRGKRKKIFHFDEKGQFRWEIGFVGGKQKRRKVRTIDGIDVEEFIRYNADDVFLKNEGYFEILNERQEKKPFSEKDKKHEENSENLFDR